MTITLTFVRTRRPSLITVPQHHKKHFIDAIVFHVSQHLIRGSFLLDLIIVEEPWYSIFPCKYFLVLSANGRTKIQYHLGFHTDSLALHIYSLLSLVLLQLDGSLRLHSRRISMTASLMDGSAASIQGAVPITVANQGATANVG